MADSWRDASGKPIPLEDLTKEQLIDRFRAAVARHGDNDAAYKGQIEALKKRLASHRKAKALANRRADKAVSALRAVVDKLASEVEQ